MTDPGVPGPRDELAARVRDVVDAADMALAQLCDFLGELDDDDPAGPAVRNAKVANDQLHRKAQQVIDRVTGRPVT
ncbi:hypothetical protein [Mycobacterium sp. SMC-4]|uniref:hypothetical protein n=1 Tax=Mycobacterium sp. SMC-4 TaxID=2857059 RepID=UPI003D07F597